MCVVCSLTDDLVTRALEEGDWVWYHSLYHTQTVAFLSLSG